MKRLVVILAIGALGLVVARSAAAHALVHAISRADAVVVTIAHEGGEPLARAAYTVLRPGDAEPFQTGLTDAGGRLVFLPDAPGDWRVRAGDASGHGLELRVPVDATGAATSVHPDSLAAAPAAAPAALRPRSAWERSARLITGVSLLFGVFGLFALFARRR